MLEKDWQSFLEVYDPHQYGDFVITKFYQPKNDLGLSYDWEKLNDLIPKELPSDRAILLGTKIDPQDNPFAPGKQESYFQSALQINANLEDIKAVLAKKPVLKDLLREVTVMFQPSASESKGLYVKF